MDNQLGLKTLTKKGGGHFMKRYSMEEKTEILKEVEEIGNINLVCKKRGISHTTVHNWIRTRGY